MVKTLPEIHLGTDPNLKDIVHTRSQNVHVKDSTRNPDDNLGIKHVVTGAAFYHDSGADRITSLISKWSEEAKLKVPVSIMAEYSPRTASLEAYKMFLQVSYGWNQGVAANPNYNYGES